MNEKHQHLFDALVQFATVIEVHPKHSLVKVDNLGKPSGWLPVMQKTNAIKHRFEPLAVGEQVVVLANKVVLGSVYHSQQEPVGSGGSIDITQYSDGTRIEYDTENKLLTINAVGSINVIANNAQVTASTVNISGESGDVVVNGISLVNHTHAQNDGNHYGGGTKTGKAQ